MSNAEYTPGKRRGYARDFSELTDADRESLVAAMVRIGREASERERRRNLRESRTALKDHGHD